MISRALLWPMRRVAIVLGVALHLGSVIVHADVPTIADMTACNQEAREESRDRSASPNSKDQVDAEAARRQRAGTAAIPGAAGAVTQSEDPQIHGMDAHGATDAAYRAAYRVCMRKKGF
ncbi:MAG: hypothetical protein DMD76_09020 [Candidatus Rokuibacteriota bacterium]|nr:MAG: hypothetical protein DMD76_09020 [Candidatus Rokubacteria bacterium]PYN84142.1 MAG: hypothetical protein DMD87_28735 [Candidatus Rokubacteria bacterium]